MLSSAAPSPAVAISVSEDGPATRWARRVATDQVAKGHVARPIIATYVGLWAVLSIAFTAAGLFLTEVVVTGDRGRWDQSVNEWFVDQRTPWADRLTGAATFIANTIPVIAIVAVCCLVLVLLRHWRAALFLASALMFEVTVFLTANTLADRARPDVPRMDSTPSTGSYPSGHAAASLALWVGLALIVTVNVRNRLVRLVAWIVAIFMAVLVAVARAYRGMHHVTDVVAGILLGLAALAAALIAVRVVSAVIDARRERMRRDEAATRSVPGDLEVPS